MKIKSLTLVVLCLISLNLVKAQEEEFTPHGKAFGTVYFNYHTGFGDETISSFEIQRAYLGYKYQISEEFSTKINLDVGKAEVEINDSTDANTSLEMTAFLKSASLTYKKGNLQIDVGLIGLLQHKIQEKIWGHRYIFKSFQDAYKLSHSADLGVQAQYKLFEELSIDFVIRNGEGYKNITDSDNAFRTGIGFSLKPVKGVILRGYYDYLEKQEAQTSVSHLLAYTNDKINAGAEYSFQLNHKDKKDHTLGGLSVFARYNLSEKFELFGRYDMLTSNTPEGESDNWNLDKDGSQIIGGVQYSPVKNIQIALNYQGWIPQAEDTDSENFVYVNFQYSF